MKMTRLAAGVTSLSPFLAAQARARSGRVKNGLPAVATLAACAGKTPSFAEPMDGSLRLRFAWRRLVEPAGVAPALYGLKVRCADC